MKIALVTDTHFGVRIDSPEFVAHFRRFYENVFFPYIDAHNIKRIIHLGDAVEHRRYINFLAIKEFRESLIHPSVQREIEMDIIIGNHDAYYKNTNKINSINELFTDSRYSKIRWHSDPTVIACGKTDIMLVPWICADNRERTFELMSTTKSKILMGHLEVAGFHMYRGVKDMGHGLDPATFSKFDMVCSGHYHHKSSVNNIHYLGAPYEITWNDYNDPRGFHVLDTDTMELTFIENKHTLFNKVYYNDDKMSPEEILAMDLSKYRGSIVKLIVSSKKDPMLFEQFVSKLEAMDLIDLTPVEDHFYQDREEYRADLINGDELADPSILFKRVAENYKHPDVPSVKLQNFLLELYREASVQQ